MTILTARNLSKSFGAHEVLRDISITLTNKARMGLVGVNGCGKTTLLRILAGELSADSGQLTLLKGTRTGYLAQLVRSSPEKTALETMQDVFLHLHAIEKRMRHLEHEMAEPLSAQRFTELAEEYERLSRRYEAEEGYAVPSRIQGVLSGLGFSPQRQEQPVAKLSGGELTRLSLAALLMRSPDLMLLDEPTNHLDLDALVWLEDYLNAFRGSIIVVSHDRYFLDRVCTGVTEILFGVSEQYHGNYSQYLQQRAERFDSRVRAYRLQQKEISRQQAIIERLRSFNREKSIRAAESREKVLEKMSLLDKPEETRRARFSFSAGRRMGYDALQVYALSKKYDGRTVFQDLNLELKSGDRAALIGANGIGKTTLLRCLSGQEPSDGGEIRYGAGVDIGYFDQKLIQLDDKKTLLDEAWGDYPSLGQGDVRGALSNFLFTGEDVFTRVGALSGGERARLAFAKLMLAHRNFLLLDEPTNHLDADSREVLEQALADFDGTVLAVSHDRYFIKRFATRILILTAEGLQVHDGDYESYVRVTQGESGQTTPEVVIKTRTAQNRERKHARAADEKRWRLKETLRAAEEAVQATETALSVLEARLADPGVYADPEKAAEVARARHALLGRLEEEYQAWEAAETDCLESETCP